MGSEHYEIVVVRYATTDLPRDRVFLNDFVNREPDVSSRLDYFFWILRNDERVVLVDTGFDAEVGAGRGRTVLVDPMDALQALEISAESAPHIIVTHMHYDHVGNVAPFTASRLTMAQTELDFWMSPTAAHAQFAHLQEDAETRGLAEAAAEGRVDFVEADTEIFPGITVLPVGGHTAGQLMVLVDTVHGPVLLTSDTVHLWEELDRRRPFIHMDHLSAAYAAYDRIDALAAETAGRVIVGHDPHSLARVPHIPEPRLPDLAWIVGPREADADER